MRVAVIGSPGIGKTCFINAFVDKNLPFYETLEQLPECLPVSFVAEAQCLTQIHRFFEPDVVITLSSDDRPFFRMIGEFVRISYDMKGVDGVFRSKVQHISKSRLLEISAQADNCA